MDLRPSGLSDETETEQLSVVSPLLLPFLFCFYHLGLLRLGDQQKLVIASC